jgi:hypothetical protein
MAWFSNIIIAFMIVLTFIYMNIKNLFFKSKLPHEHLNVYLIIVFL